MEKSAENRPAHFKTAPRVETAPRILKPLRGFAQAKNQQSAFENILRRAATRISRATTGTKNEDKDEYFDFVTDIPRSEERRVGKEC